MSHPEVSSDTSSVEEFLQQVKRYDFLHVAYVDLNGLVRTLTMPVDSVPCLVAEGRFAFISQTTFSFSGSVLSATECENEKYKNVILRPVLNTLRAWPTLGPETGTKTGQVFCSTFWRDGSSVEADARAIAMRQVQRLRERKLDIFLGNEVEFWLFEQTGIREKPRPAHHTGNKFFVPHSRQYEKLYVELDQKLRDLGFTYEAFHTEFADGQLQVVLPKHWGIDAVDNLVRFKLIVKDTAQDSGYCCSFMTQPLPGQKGSGTSFNHSIWRRETEEEPTVNVMFEEADPLQISKFARFWMAGILQHGNALTALTSPTVNCFRRLRSFSKSCNTWAVHDPTAGLRVRNGGTESRTSIEDRTPSSSCNAYLVLAGMIAAGLDGVDRKLELPEEGARDLGATPGSVTDALESLQKDEQLNEALGEEFVDWFAALKIKEAEELQCLGESDGGKNGYKMERELYFDFA